jgi:Carboxypeptidase regulatory-like domain
MRACPIAYLRLKSLFLFAPILIVVLSGGTGLESQQADQPNPAAEPTRITVQGIVRNAASGDPLPRALVEIEGDASTGTLTDGEGHFEIPGVPLGPQTIRVAKPGFRDRPYASEEPGLDTEGPAHSVLLAAEMPELTFALSPDCAIHGHIALSTGDPAEGVPVLLLKQLVHNGRAVWAEAANTHANGDGAYRFGGLPDGVYAVYTQPTFESEPAVSLVAAGSSGRVTRSGYPAVFYPDARDLAAAGRIRLTAGAEAEANFNLALEPFYPVSAFVGTGSQASEAGKMRQPGGASAVLMDVSGHALPYPVEYDEASHSLQANLPDGSYMMLAGRGIQSRIESMLTPSGGVGGRPMSLAGTAEFTVAGRAISGLHIRLAPPSAATVHLRLLHSPESTSPSITSNSAADLVNLNLDSADGVPLVTSDTIWSMENGAEDITFTALPGNYWLSAFLPRKGFCAGPFNAGSFNLAHEPLTLSLAASPPPMEFTLRDDCASLALTLPATQSTFLPGDEPFFTVYVVPDFDTVQDIRPMTMHPSSGPTLNLDSLTPGNYHVYTFDSPTHLEYRNPAALAALPNAGQQVTLSSGAPASLVLEVPEH